MKIHPSENPPSIYDAAIEAALDPSRLQPETVLHLRTRNLRPGMSAEAYRRSRMAAAEIRNQPTETINYSILIDLFDKVRYPRVSPRITWQKFQSVSDRLVEMGGLPILKRAEESLFPIPSIPDRATSNERYIMRRRMEDMEEFSRDMLIVENLKVFETLEETSKEFGSILTAKLVAGDIYKIYGPSDNSSTQTYPVHS